VRSRRPLLAALGLTILVGAAYLLLRPADFGSARVAGLAGTVASPEPTGRLLEDVGLLLALGDPVAAGGLIDAARLSDQTQPAEVRVATLATLLAQGRFTEVVARPDLPTMIQGGPSLQAFALGLEAEAAWYLGATEQLSRALESALSLEPDARQWGRHALWGETETVQRFLGFLAGLGPEFRRVVPLPTSSEQAFSGPIPALAVKVGEVEVKATLDTGAGLTVIARSVAGAAGVSGSGLPVVLRGYGDDAPAVTGELVILPVVDLPGWSLVQVPAVMLEDALTATLTGPDSPGAGLILGLPEIAQFRLTVDYPARRVWFAPTGTPADQPSSFALIGGAVVLPVQGSGIRAGAIVDTGASLSAFSPGALDLLLPGWRERRIGAGLTVRLGGAERRDRILVDGLDVGNWRLDGVLATVTESGSVRFLGLIGAQALRPFQLTIDLLAGEVSLDPAR